MYRAAIIQTAPVLLEREETIQKAVNLVGQAAAQGAGLIVLPEAFIPGYPAWIWRLRPGTDWDLSEALHARLLANAVDLERGDLAPLEAAARTHGVSVVCGMNEREGRLGRTTLYNTVVVIGPTGEILNRHRKLMPTNPERMVWGLGDGSGLKVVETPCGRLGTLICWESYMPLARYALYGQGIEIYVAPTYDSGEDWLGTLQHIAREGRCWVLGSGTLLRGSDIPADLPGRSVLYPDPDEWVNPGDSVVIAPGGGIVAGPLHREEGILFAEIDRGRVGAARRALDVVGHYARPDIFRLHVDTQPQTPLELE
jgi:nitrilase